LGVGIWGGGVSGGTDARLLLVLHSITLVCVYPVRLMRGVVQTRGMLGRKWAWKGDHGMGRGGGMQLCQPGACAA
jgi:hypothetical protein